jgi:hypothetical protein
MEGLIILIGIINLYGNGVPSAEVLQFQKKKLNQKEKYYEKES